MYPYWRTPPFGSCRKFVLQYSCYPVDVSVGVAMVDLLRNCDRFTVEEATEYIENGAFNDLFCSWNKS